MTDCWVVTWLQHSHNILSFHFFGFFYSFQTKNIGNIPSSFGFVHIDSLQYSWSSSNAIQKAFYKGFTFLPIDSLHSNVQVYPILHSMPNLSTILGIYLLNLLHLNALAECTVCTQDHQQHLQYVIPAPVPFLLAPPANPLPNNQQDPFAITRSSHNIAPPANPLPNNQQDPFPIAGSSCNVDGSANPLPINQRNPFVIAGSLYNIKSPALTPGTAIANIHVQLTDGPQLESLSRHNPAALKPPAKVGRAAVEALFA
ncbi:hypothetical protein BU17DRAFT_94596 [Hysterangium stoloniferum]|nr:hypothetical protein BU17DRAFT_94596 [Hysterangium stoloniferum]